MTAMTSTPEASVAEFLLVPFRARTWKNLAYLGLAMPIGIAWFVLLVTGVSLGAGLLITLVGLPLLLLVVLGSRAAAALERGLARTLTGVAIEPAPVITRSARPGAWSRLKAVFTDGLTWRGLLFLLLRMPIGIAAFTITVTILAVVAAFLTAPLTFASATVGVPGWTIDTWPEALAASMLGAVMLVPALHLLNLLARGMGELARVLTGPAAQHPPAPVPGDTLASVQAAC